MRRLKSVDFPTFGRPMIAATGIVSLTRAPPAPASLALAALSCRDVSVRGDRHLCAYPVRCASLRCRPVAVEMSCDARVREERAESVARDEDRRTHAGGEIVEAHAVDEK